MSRGGRYNDYIDHNARIDDVYAKFKRKCKCGHSMIIPNNGRWEYRLCKWCGGRMYIDKEKQKIYDRKREEEEYRFNLERFKNMLKDCISNIEEMEKQAKLKKLKRKFFKKDKDYFKFCDRDDVTIYNVVIGLKSNDKKIMVYYGPKRGRPKRNKCKKKENKR